MGQQRVQKPVFMGQKMKLYKGEISLRVSLFLLSNVFGYQLVHTAAEGQLTEPPVWLLDLGVTARNVTAYKKDCQHWGFIETICHILGVVIRAAGRLSQCSRVAVEQRVTDVIYLFILSLCEGGWNVELAMQIKMLCFLLLYSCCEWCVREVNYLWACRD